MITRNKVNNFILHLSAILSLAGFGLGLAMLPTTIFQDADLLNISLGYLTIGIINLPIMIYTFRQKMRTQATG